MKHLLKLILNCVFLTQMLLIAICFEKMIWRMSIVIFANLFSFFNFINLKNISEKIKTSDHLDGMSLRIVILSYWRKEEIHINILHFRKKKSHIDWHREQLILSSNIIVTQFDGAGDMILFRVL